MFINFSNHPSDRWDINQVNAAIKYGEIIDIAFPEVPATADENAIIKLAEEYTTKIINVLPGSGAVMVQGEFTLSYVVINRLKEKNIKVLAACSERNVIETIDDDGNSIKKSIFSFARFREYT